MYLLLIRFSRVRLCATPQTAARQAPPSLGFSRQEHWSGLPFPSPMHESEKWKWSRSVVSDSSQTHGLQPTRVLHPWDFPGKSTGVGCHCLLQICTYCHSNGYFFLFSSFYFFPWDLITIFNVMFGSFFVFVDFCLWLPWCLHTYIYVCVLRHFSHVRLYVTLGNETC